MYDEIQGIVDDLLGEYGSKETYAYLGGSKGTLNPATGKYEGATDPTRTKVNAIFGPIDSKWVDGQTVLITDIEIKVSPKGLTSFPVVGTEIERGSEKYKVLNPIEIKPGDTTLFLRYHARQT
jgi:hypothetical protein